MTPPSSPASSIGDPFVHTGNSTQTIANNQVNAINLSGSALNKYNKWMAQVSALLATIPDGLASFFLSKKILKTCFKLIFPIDYPSQI